MIPAMYCAQWFMTLFSYSLPFGVVTRVWDAFLKESFKIIFRVGLAILKKAEGKTFRVRVRVFNFRF